MNTIYKKPTEPNQGLFNSNLEGEPQANLDFSLIEVKDGKVNARGLWQFLGISQEFANWIKYQIETLDLIENEDFDKIVKTIGIRQNGQIDYLLKIDTSKELAMLSRTENGKKARRYFIECEKQLKQPKKQLSTLDILELATGEIKKLKADLDYKNQIVIERAESVPPEKMRITINRVVRNYAKAQNTIHQFVWGELYDEFKYLYHIDLRARAKKGISKIQIAEDLGRLEDLYNLALKLFEADKIK